jgi:NAD(P)-dependent dehydrogenase (short-subunit alcohol dehydrogenase family)
VAGRTIAVTGAASGLGKALRARLEADGARVIGVDLHSCEISADLSSPGGRAAAIAGVLRASDGVLDGVVPCAGVGPQHPPDRIIAINYFGAVATVVGLIDAVASSSASPAIVMISSNSTTMTPGAYAELAEACRSLDDESRALAIAADAHPAVAYAASKVGVGRFVRRSSLPFGARGVRINSVAPGAFDTPLLQQGLDDPATKDLIEAIPIPLGRRGQPDDIADVITWLLSDGARYVNGANLFVDGGTDAQLSPERFP